MGVPGKMRTAFGGILQAVARVSGIPLYADSVYLILNSGVTTLLTFLFWVFVTHRYAAADVGTVSALLSAGALLASVSSLGLVYTLLRYLPASGTSASHIVSSAMNLSGLTGLLAAIVFLAGAPLWSPALVSIARNPGYILEFAILVLFLSVGSVVFPALVGLRGAIYVLVQGTVLGVLRIVLLVAFAGFRALGIFAAWTLAQVAVVALGMWVLLARFQCAYRPFPVLDIPLLRRVLPFSLLNYVSGVFWNLPTFLLPLVVVNTAGPESAAYFSIALSIAQLPWVASWAVSNVLLAEGSRGPQHLPRDTLRSLALCGVLLSVAIGGLFLWGRAILELFGYSYAQFGTPTLLMLAFVAFPRTVNEIYLSVKRVNEEMSGVVAWTFAVAAGTLAGAIFLIPRLGIMGAAVAWLVAQGVGAAVALRHLTMRWRTARENEGGVASTDDYERSPLAAASKWSQT